MGPSFKEKELVSLIKSLRVIMRQFLGVSGTIRRKLGPGWGAPRQESTPPQA